MDPSHRDKDTSLSGFLEYCLMEGKREVYVVESGVYGFLLAKQISLLMRIQ